MNWTRQALSLAVVGLLCTSIAQATTIELQLADVDIEYSSASGSITDAGATNDELAGVFVFVNGVQQGALTGAGLSLDLEIPGIPAIPATGGTVSSAAGGSISVFTPGLILDLTLQSTNVTYQPIGSIFDFVFVGTVGSINAQNIPFLPSGGLGEPVSLTLSTQADSLNTALGVVTDFAASGTGELEGPFTLNPDNVIPEPSSLFVVAIGCLGLAARRRI